MTSHIFYVVYDDKTENHLDIINLVDMMEKGDVREVLKPGSKDECVAWCAQYTKENPYTPQAVVEQQEIAKARQNAGKDLGNTVKRDFPLQVNGVLTNEEKMEMLQKTCEDVGFALHAALVYTGETRDIEAQVIAKTGEKYYLTFKRLP